MMNRLIRHITLAALLTGVAFVNTTTMSAQAKPATTPAAPAGVAPDWTRTPTSERGYKVKLDFNRWHDVAELQADLRTLEKAYPKFLKYISLGKSYDGRE